MTVFKERKPTQRNKQSGPAMSNLNHGAGDGDDTANEGGGDVKSSATSMSTPGSVVCGTSRTSSPDLPQHSTR